MSPSANPAPDSPDPQRMQLVEERLTFQQKLIDDLSTALAAQQGDIAGLRRELHDCRATIEQLLAAGLDGEDLPHEKPPHY
ncbi:MAG: SlyX family protein [Planctomycetales bacterium]|nr:SlyX family protein [Planctomycetales bacterium]